MVGPLAEAATPLRALFWTALCNNADNASAQMRNKYDDKGSLAAALVLEQCSHLVDR